MGEAAGGDDVGKRRLIEDPRLSSGPRRCRTQHRALGGQARHRRAPSSLAAHGDCDVASRYAMSTRFMAFPPLVASVRRR